MAGAGQACVTLGALAALVGVIMGVVFMLNEEFVVATFQCNPDAVGAQSNSSICVDNAVVINGETCQVGNLGLYTAAFTPECLDSTPFAISPIVTRGSSPTTEFPVLFPAQTGLSGAAAAVGVSVEFESCETFFDAGNAAVGAAITRIGVGAAQSSFKDEDFGLPAAIKGTFDQGIVDAFAGLDGAFADTPTSVYGLASQTYFAAAGNQAIPLDVTAAYNGNASGVVAGLRDLENSLGPINGALAGAVASAIELGSLFIASTNTITLISHGLAFGTPEQGGPLTTMPDSGLYENLGPVLCGLAGVANCQYIDWLIFLETQLIPGSDDQIALASALTLLQNVLEPVAGGIFSVANVRGSFVNLTIAGTYTKDVQIEILQGVIPVSSAVPDNWLVPAVTTSGGQFYALLCQSVEEADTCTFQEFLTATYNGLLAANSTLAAALEDAEGIVRGCALLNASGLISVDGSIDECTAEFLTTSNPFLGGAQPIVGLFDDVLGNFYGAIDEGLSQSAALDAAEAECLLDEQDKAAIEQAQVLFPAGVGLSGVGLLVALLNLALFAGSGMSRYIGLFAGVLALVGLVLAVVALLGVYNAPIYASLGAGEGEVPDGEQLFSSGIGFTFVLVSLAGAAVGAILITAGALFLKTEDPAVDIMKA